MKRTRRNWLAASVILQATVCCSWAGANEGEPLIGDERDGSRAAPVHLIPLYDEDGQTISATDDPLLPFSPRQTCARECHSYDRIEKGWHFNAHDPNVQPGRRGHPWIFVDAATGTQIPLSHRAWPGTYRPEEIGLTSRQFIKRFGRHLPGGEIRGRVEGEGPGDVMRELVSGKLEVNCLACHNADPSHNQADYAVQIARENFRWAATATSGFTSVKGSAKDMPDTYDYLMPDPPNDPKLVPPSVAYRPEALDPDNRVFFHVVRKIPARRCYFCHSSKFIPANGEAHTLTDEDVHLSAGMTCTDCHRNDIGHNMTRGLASESHPSDGTQAASLSCRGCHLGIETVDRPTAGRSAAPVPLHKGLPPIHLERLTCTACHSGPWPEQRTGYVKTSLAHGLGTHNVDKSSGALPRIVSPVFAEAAEERIAPYNLLWPAFWAVLQSNEITPLPMKIVEGVMREIGAERGLMPVGAAGLPSEPIAKILRGLASEASIQGKPVYVADGGILMLDEGGKLNREDHQAAQPYLWPVAHDVRPAAQSLGSRGCEDCHSSRASFFFGEVAGANGHASKPESARVMIDFQNQKPIYTTVLALAFKLRPLFKLLILTSVGIVLIVVLIYTVKALICTMNYFNERGSEG